jgi:hypothetical protein
MAPTTPNTNIISSSDTLVNPIGPSTPQHDAQLETPNTAIAHVPTFQTPSRFVRRHPIDLFGPSAATSDGESFPPTRRATLVERMQTNHTSHGRNVERLRQLLRTGTRDLARNEEARNEAREVIQAREEREREARETRSASAIIAELREAGEHFVDASTSTVRRRDSHMHSSFRNKNVLELQCKFCQCILTDRAMSAILLADTSVQLFSTDLTPSGCSIVGVDYRTNNCSCRIRDLACLNGCGNVVGYHVVLPCSSCLGASHNSHMFMFHSEIIGIERFDESGSVLKWGSLLGNSVERPSPSHTPCR